MTDIEKLKELEARLRAIEADPIGGGLARHWFRNPDGPEAADTITALLASLASKDAEIERQAQALREMTFSRDTWRKVATGRGSDIERETKIARAAEARLAAALAALGEARVYLAAIVRFLNVPPRQAQRARRE